MAPPKASELLSKDDVHEVKPELLFENDVYNQTDSGSGLKQSYDRLLLDLQSKRTISGWVHKKNDPYS